MNFFQKLVEKFHEATGLTVNKRPSYITEADRVSRLKVLEEEFEEYKKATEEQDLVKIADAIGDMLYVLFGSAVCYGIDMMPVFLEIHQSNMSKKFPDGKFHRNEFDKVLKPSTYKKPNIENIIHFLLTEPEDILGINEKQFEMIVNVLSTDIRNKDYEFDVSAHYIIIRNIKSPLTIIMFGLFEKINMIQNIYGVLSSQNECYLLFSKMSFAHPSVQKFINDNDKQIIIYNTSQNLKGGIS